MENEENLLKLDSQNIIAYATETVEGFVLKKGSHIRKCNSDYLSKKIISLKEECYRKGTIVDDILLEDLCFASSTTAANFVLGVNVSGPKTWKYPNGMTLREKQMVLSGKYKSDEDREYLGFYKVVDGNEGSKCYYPARLDTYGCGCAHDCKYCYAKDLIERLSGEWSPSHPKIADLARIENKLKQIPQGTILRLGGLTDCFQPVEKKYRTTLETIKLLNKYNIGYLIVTKSHIVADEEYRKVMRKDLAHIQITTTTFDAALCARYEKASPPDLRVKAIETLYKEGFDTSFRLSPYVDGWVDFERLQKIQCNKILVEFLRVNSTIASRFGVDMQDYPVLEAGFYHMSLEHKLEVLSKIKGFEFVTVCDDCTEHYNYFKYNFNPNVNDCCNLRKEILE